MMTRLQKRFFAAGELVLADLFWGFGFVAAIWVLAFWGPFTTTWVRFLLAGSAGVAIGLVVPSLRSSLAWDQWRLALWPSLWLSLTLTIQTVGLKYTTATKGGFITTLYVLIVPLLEMAFLKRRLPRIHFFYVFVALIGTAMICEIHGDSLNRGDFIVLISAVAASVQIFWFVLISHKIRSPLIFNSIQCLWAAVLPFALALFLESTPWNSPPLSSNGIWAMLSLTFGSTFFAFALQIKAQKALSPSVASLLFLLESPFAALFGAYFLMESLNANQWFGGALILLTAIATVVRKP